MKILYLTDQIHLHGGAEKILIQKLNYWVEYFNYNVTLITTEQRDKKPFFPLNKNVNLIDLKINYIEGVSFFNPTNFLKLPNHYKMLKYEVERLQPDAIFVISRSYVRLLAPLITNGISIFNEYHTSYYSTKLSLENVSIFKKIKIKLVDTFISKIETHYTKIIFLNQEEYDYYNLSNAVIIPNFFDEKVPEILGERKNSIVTLGRLCYQKGYDILIDVWEIVDKKVEGWELNIYGNGNDYESLAQKINDKKFRNPLNLRAATNNINEKLSESSFYVMSSRYETFPMVLLEALSNKLPVVSFDSPTGARNILVNNEDSLLAEPNNISDLATKILLLINNRDLRESMGVKALSNVKRFSAMTVMNKWDDLIKSNKK